MTDPLATPKVSFTSRDFNSFVTDFLNFVRATRPDAYTDFSNGQLGTILVDLAAAVVDQLSFGQDMVAQELFLSTCTRYGSALRFANSVGYTPRLATAATVTVKSTTALPSTLTSYGGIVAKGTKIKGQNGLSYELQEDYAVAIGDTIMRLNLKEGESFRETIGATAQQNQVVKTQNGVVEEDSWSVYVGDPDDPENLWEQVDNVTFETSATKTYDTSFDDEGRLSVRFGDGSAGMIPSSAITIDYRKTNGAAGNVPVSAIRGAVKVSIASPGTGTVSVPMENRDDEAAISGGTQLHSNEPQGNTVASATQTGTVENTPILTGSLNLTIELTGGGGVIVLTDTGSGTFSVTSNTTILTLASSAITYSTGAWAVTLSAPIAAGGVMSATYFSVVEAEASSAALVGAATGGQDRESLIELKKNIPAYIRSQNKVLTETDYADALAQVSGIALSFVAPYVSSYTANLVRIAVWGSEVVGFQSENKNGPLGAPTDYLRYMQVQQNRVLAIQQFLRDRTLVTVSHVILRPAMLWVDLYLGNVVYDKRQDPVTVRKSITEAVVAVFQEGSGFAIRLSDVYDAVRSTPGVLYFTLMRAATGTQETSSEVQGTTAASPTVSGTLQAPIASPGSVEITIQQTSGATIVIADDGAGGFTVKSGVATLNSGSINYRTGAWTVTFDTNLVANQPVTASYANVTNDYREDQIVTLDAAEDNDAWPPPGVIITNPVSTPPYGDGLPLSAERAGVAQSPPYLPGDVLTYAKLKDITVDAALTSRHYYNDEYLYNNEIYYDSVTNTTTDVRAIVLRRLVFELVAG